jgi:dihydropyrimidinase
MNAEGCFVLPGAVDEHVHPIYLDDPSETAAAAALGGTTTLMHFAYATPGRTLVEAIEEMIAAGRRGVLDFAVHVAFFDAATQVADMDGAAELGVRSFKMFLTYASLGWMTDDFQLMRIMDHIARLDGIAMVHAENGPAIEYLEGEVASGRRVRSDAIETWLSTRPAILEAEGVFRAIAMAEVAGCDLFIPHVTSRRALEVVSSARARGARVVAETCPHYLALSDAALHSQGALAKVGPPLRRPDDAEALWLGLRNGVLSAVGSDHAPKKTESARSEDILDAGFGAPAVQTLLTVLYDEGVNTGRISLPELVRITSENPARIFGLYPKKGTIAVGADADLVLWDPAQAHVVRAQSQRSNAGYTLYEDRRCLGAPRAVLRRGDLVVDEGELIVSEGGEFLSSGPYDVLLT